MEFKKFSAGVEAYGTGERPEEKQLSNVCFSDPKFIKHMNNIDQYEDLRKYMLFLATCHSIIIDERKGTYNASSPDELALVNFAK
jgi:magnesium-transporting ATPase (P-type)